MNSPHRGSSWPDTPDAVRLADHLLDVLALASRRVRREMRRNSGPGLTVSQFRGLRYVERHPGTGLTGLAAHLGMSRSSASALVERLVRSGHASRSTDPTERRRIRIDLTEQGQSVIGRSAHMTRQWLSRELGSMTSADRVRLEAALDVLAALGTSAESVGTQAGHAW